MGKTARWFRGLLGGKKAGGPAVASDSKPPKEKKRWGFVRSFKDKERTAPPSQVMQEAMNGSYREGTCPPYGDEAVDQNKHAIAVAAATAAVAEAAVAAAQAAAAVVRLTSSSGRRPTAAYVSGKREDSAAVKIQSAFRGYLARRALRALKGLVKLQALVRGHIVRKQTAEALRCMQALVRVQARARVVRAIASEKNPVPRKGSQLQTGPPTPEKHEPARRTSSTKHQGSAILKRNASKTNGIGNVYVDGVNMNWLDRWMDEQSRGHESPGKGRRANDEKSDKILEIDPGKPHFNSKRRNSSLQSSHSTLKSHSFTAMPDSPSKDSTTAQLSNLSPSSVEMPSLSPLRFPVEVDDLAFCTANNSPQFFSASSRPGSAKRGPFTLAKSDCSRSLLSGYSDYPNYMANTEASRAKVRSQSAPKQRPEFEKSSSTKRSSVHGIGDARASMGTAQTAQRSSSLHAKFTSKAYPGSGRLDKLGMPVQVIGYNGASRSRF